MQETTETAASTPAAPRTDRLELVKELSRGSIGVVHRAKNPQLGRVIALRQFEVPQWLDDVNELLKRIISEAKNASALDHANIAKLYTCGYRGFTVFMTSEFVEGKTLKELTAARSLDFNEILSIAKQLCAALDYAHEKGIYHQLLNPSNIKVLPDGTVKLLDFGLLRDKHLLSQTPAKKLENEPYLSPEQLKSKPPDRAANLFSLGTILYELYTARNPFAGMHLGEIDRAILDVTPHPLNLAHQRVPATVSSVILKALSKSPAERYQSGKQLVAALEAATRPDSIRAAATPSPKPATASTAQVNAKAPEKLAAKLFPQNVSKNKADAATAKPATVKPATTQPANTKVPPVPAASAARPQARSLNQWKLLGMVVAGLVVVSMLAFLFQRRATDDADTLRAQPMAAKPAKPSVPLQTPTPTLAAEPESVPPETLEPLEESSDVPHAVRRSKDAFAGRAAPAAAEGQITISSVPADATVQIEGLSQSWKTPQTIASLAPGTYKITVSKPGYAPDVRIVELAAGNRVSIDVRLNVIKGFLNIGGSPAGASVFIDDADTGKFTPASFILDPASHRILLRKAGYIDSTNDMQLAAGQTVSYAPTLAVAGRTDNIKILGSGVTRVLERGSSAGKGRIEIRSDPKGAQVTINGTTLQKTTPVEIQVEAGNYDITLQKDGYKAVHENTIVGIEERVKIDKTLSR